jgi:hypothetical protein
MTNAIVNCDGFLFIKDILDYKMIKKIMGQASGLPLNNLQFYRLDDRFWQSHS